MGGGSGTKVCEECAVIGVRANEWDARSAMQFASPGMWKVASGDAWQASICKARVCKMCTAGCALDAKSLDAQATVGMLSHPTAM